MGRFLRVLTVFIFLLSIAALTLGILLFNRREELKGRTQKLETAVRRFARALEAEEPPEPDPVPTYAARDESEVSAQPVTDPLRSDFWNRYNHALEEGSPEFMDLDSQARLRQLMRYFRWDDVENKAWRDPVTGQKGTDGPGTMQELLDQVQRQAEAQLARLLRTRAELVKTRRELVVTVTELNQHKTTLRDRMAEIVRLNSDIQRLNGEIRRRDDQIVELQETVSMLERRVADLEQERQRLEEERDDLRIRNEQHVQTIRELRDAARTPRDAGLPPGPGLETVGVVNLTIAAGVKGDVVRVDDDYGFVVMRLSQDFLNELRRQLATPDHIPSVRLNVQRGDGDDARFVTKVQLTQLREGEGLGIGTILHNWQQMPVEPGDTIFFQ